MIQVASRSSLPSAAEEQVVIRRTGVFLINCWPKPRSPHEESARKAAKLGVARSIAANQGVARRTAANQGVARRTAMKPPSPAEFDEVLRLIDAVRTRAVAAVNTALIELYWTIGEYISGKIESAAWGEGVVDQLADHIARSHPGLRGYTHPNLFRMRQFYETYRADKKVSPLVRQLPWTHNLLILSRSKLAAEREFYLRMSISEKWSKRELERQLAGACSSGSYSPPQKSHHR